MKIKITICYKKDEYMKGYFDGLNDGTEDLPINEGYKIVEYQEQIMSNGQHVYVTHGYVGKSFIKNHKNSFDNGVMLIGWDLFL